MLLCRAALSLTLVRYSSFIAWGVDMRRFPQLILSLSCQEKAAAMMASRLASRHSARPAVRVLVSYHAVIVHSFRSKQEGGGVFLIYHGSPFASCPVSSNPPPVARCLIRFAHPSRPSPCLASRYPSRSHIVSSLVPSRLARCVARLPPVLRSRRFVQLVSPFSPCLAVLIAS